MAEFPALPLWTDAYLADTAHLSDAENGLYIRLLILIWRSPLCRIPNDDSWLERRLGASLGIRPIIKEFCKCDGNWITQKRLLHEWKYVRAKSQQNSDAAKSRWRKEKDVSERNADRHSERNAPTPTPTPTPNGKKVSSSISNFVVGKNGVGNGSHVTIKDPAARLSKFQQWLATKFPSQGEGWTAIIAASDKADPNYSTALELCKQTAKLHGKGWPRQWL